MAVETRVFDSEELDALLAQVNVRTPSGARNFALLTLMANTGLRCGEALQVEWGHIRQETWTNGKRAKVWTLRLPKWATKGKRDRMGLPLSPSVMAALEAWKTKRDALGIQGGPLFCTISTGTVEGITGQADLQPGKPLNSRYVRELVQRLASRAGITRRAHPHMLRHTALTNLYDKTKDLRMVQEIAGHTTSRMTERYTQVHPLAAAAAMGAIAEE